MYKLIKSPITGLINVVNKIEDGRVLSIPFYPANQDAQQFKIWLQEGNIPTSADSETIVTQEEVDAIITLLNG
jgi:hypothetical protein